MRYPAKLLLLGEYTVMNSSHALSRPYYDFWGSWAWGEAKGESLFPFLQYLESSGGNEALVLQFDLEKFRQDLEEGMWFSSNIPQGYGLGSSGALCAATYDRYALNKIERNDFSAFATLRKQFAFMESFFHGASSGTDPLASYLEQPVLLLQGGKVESVFLPEAEAPFRFFLLDTGMERKTGPLVQHFLEQCMDPAYANAIHTRLAPANNGAIQAWLSGDIDRLFQHWSNIEKLEFEYLLHMIPMGFREIWENSLHSDTYRLKLCGAGGGGFLLGITRDWYLTRKRLSDWPLRML